MKVLFILFILFASTFAFAQSDTNGDVTMTECVDFPDVLAHYPGGEKAMNKFLLKNLSYPQEAMERADQGTVYVEFIIEKDGSLTHIQIRRGVSQELDKEAKRLIQLMPLWIPGETGGEKIRTRAVLPVKFILS